MVRSVSCDEKGTARRPVLLTVRRAVLCLLWNYASVWMIWQLLDYSAMALQRNATLWLQV